MSRFSYDLGDRRDIIRLTSTHHHACQVRRSLHRGWITRHQAERLITWLRAIIRKDTGGFVPHYLEKL